MKEEDDDDDSSVPLSRDPTDPKEDSSRSGGVVSTSLMNTGGGDKKEEEGRTKTPHSQSTTTTATTTTSSPAEAGNDSPTSPQSEIHRPGTVDDGTSDHHPPPPPGFYYYPPPPYFHPPTPCFSTYYTNSCACAWLSSPCWQSHHHPPYANHDPHNVLIEYTTTPPFCYPATTSTTTAAAPFPPSVRRMTMIPSYSPASSTTSTPSSHYDHDPPPVLPSSRQRRRRHSSDHDSKDSASWLSASSPDNNNYNKRTTACPKKTRNDHSLLGKTAVAALYEFCAKRNIVPQSSFFHSHCDLFTATVVVVPKNTTTTKQQPPVSATGEASTKASAKAIAARRALEELLPGILFDEETNIVVQLPQPWSAEDLAPRLAQRLAIGNNHNTISTDSSNVAANHSNSSKRRSFDMLGSTTTATSTTSEEEGGRTNAKASIYSSLLHTMQQIDSRLPEPPQYEYEMNEAIRTTGNGSSSQLHRTSTIKVHRGSFTCTAKLKRLQDGSQLETLSAQGFGSTKRDARHSASAKLLARLFPEHESLADVQKAAEAAREAHALSRSEFRNNHSFDSKIPAAKRKKRDQDTPPHILLTQDSDSVLPDQVKAMYSLILQQSGTLRISSGTRTRQELARQEQLSKQVAKALECINESEDKSEASSEDIGKTILREASSDDWRNMEGLFRSSKKDLSKWSLDDGTIVLLLCRAIAPYDSPPLGCAILSLGFSMEFGKVLYTSCLATESHLPSERFLEVLEEFAHCMNCRLIQMDASTAKISSYTPLELQGFLRTFCAIDQDEKGSKDSRNSKNCIRSRFSNKPSSSIFLPSTRLSSVQEESELEDDSWVEVDSQKKKPKDQSKNPATKRSRVN